MTKKVVYKEKAAKKCVFAIILLATTLILAGLAQAGQLAHNVALNSTSCQESNKNAVQYGCEHTYDNAWGAHSQHWLTTDAIKYGNITIALNGSLKIANITIMAGIDYRAGNYTIWGSTDNLTWTLWNSSLMCDFDMCTQTHYKATGFPTANFILINVSDRAKTGVPVGVGIAEIFLHEWDTISPEHVVSLTINAKDVFDQNPINNLSVNVSNATFSVVNSTTTGSLLFAGVTNITNYTVTVQSNESGGYYNVTFNVSVDGITTASAYMYQSYVNFNGTEIFSGGKLTSMNISAVNSSGFGQFNASTNNLAVLLLKPGNYSVSGASPDFFNVSLTINISALANITINITTFGNALLNVTAYNVITNQTISEYTLNVKTTNATPTFNYSTLTSDVLNVLALKGHNITLTVFKSNLTVTPKNFSLNTTQQYYNLSVFLQNVNSISILFFSESLNKQFGTTPEANETISLSVIGPVVLNLTTPNGTIFISQLTPGTYEFRYSATSFRERTYYTTLTNNTAQILNFYLLNNTLGTQIVPTIVDANSNPINGSILKLLRFYTSENAFKTVEMSRANFNGLAPIFAVFSSGSQTQNYKIIIENGGIAIFESSETKLTDLTPRIQITLGKSNIALVKGLSNIYTSMVDNFQNYNHTISYTYTDTTGFAIGGCLTAITSSGTQICNVCSASTASSLICAVNSGVNGGTVSVEGRVNTTSNGIVTTDVLQINTESPYTGFGDFGPFLGLFLLILIPFVGIWSVSVAVILTLFALGISLALHILIFPVGIIIELAIGALLIITKSRGD